MTKPASTGIGSATFDHDDLDLRFSYQRIEIIKIGNAIKHWNGSFQRPPITFDQPFQYNRVLPPEDGRHLSTEGQPRRTASP